MIEFGSVEFFKQKIIDEFKEHSHYYSQISANSNRVMVISYNHRSGVYFYLDNVNYNHCDDCRMVRKHHQKEFEDIIEFLRLLCEVDSL